MNEHELKINEVICSIYDNAIAFSLRDRDDNKEDIDNHGVVKRFRLACRTAENLLLTDEVLSSLDIEWKELEKRIDDWLEKNSSHPHRSDMLGFKNSGYDRKNADLKNIRNDLMGIIAKSKPWEVAVGQTLGGLVAKNNFHSSNENSILNYLGARVVDEVLKQC
jgi:hypothetical protein